MCLTEQQLKVKLPDREHVSSQNMSSHQRLHISGVNSLNREYFMCLLGHTVSENSWLYISSLENNSVEFQVVAKLSEEWAQGNVYSAVRAALAESTDSYKLLAFLC